MKTSERKNEYCRPLWLAFAILSALIVCAAGVIQLIELRQLWYDMGAVGKLGFILRLVGAVMMLAGALGGIVGAASKERSVSFLSSLFVIVGVTIYPIYLWYSIAAGLDFSHPFYFDFSSDTNRVFTLSQLSAYAAAIGLVLDLVGLSRRFAKKKSTRLITLIGMVFLFASAAFMASNVLIGFDLASFGGDVVLLVKSLTLSLGNPLALVLVGIGNLALSQARVEKKKEEEPRLNLDGEEEDKDVIVVE